MKRRGILVVVSGFSGAGKGTLMKNLLKTYDNYALSISMTTRQPREGEKEGREYFFVSEEMFKEKAAQEGLIEDFWNMQKSTAIITARRRSMWRHSLKWARMCF